MELPIYSALTTYDKVRFHMPGHSGIDFGEFKEFHMDVTEVIGMDNLLAANGIIKEGEDLIAKAYEYKHSIMVTSGSTICMQMSAYTIKQMGLEVIAVGDMHSSFYNAMHLFEISYIEVEDIQKCLDVIRKNQKQVAIFITSPNYFGQTKDTDLLYANKGNNILVIDAAHAAHFPFSSVLPKYPKGDIVFSSMHKTMPVHTGGAIINVDNEYLYEMLLLNLSKMHSTSPSYITLGSMDLARAYFEMKGEEFYKAIKAKVDSYNGKFGMFDIIKTDDISRFVLEKKGVDCYKIIDLLHDIGFEVEMAYEDRIVFILTPFNYERLDDIVSIMSKVPTQKLETPDIKVDKKEKENIEGLRPDFVDIDKAEGLIANADICIYPPSTPIVRYGEKIGKEDINIFKAHLGHILGLVNNKVPVLK